MAAQIKDQVTPGRGVRHLPWLLRGFLILIFLASGASAGAAFRLGRGGRALVPDTTTFDFGQIVLRNGIVSTRFPLHVQQATVITDVNSSRVCTRARIVQGREVSGWLGMGQRVQRQPRNQLLNTGEPAYVEIAVDPAAHGAADVGPFTSRVTLKTSAGQELLFKVTGNVVP